MTARSYCSVVEFHSSCSTFVAFVWLFEQLPDISRRPPLPFSSCCIFMSAYSSLAVEPSVRLSRAKKVHPVATSHVSANTCTWELAGKLGSPTFHPGPQTPRALALAAQTFLYANPWKMSHLTFLSVQWDGERCHAAGRDSQTVAFCHAIHQGPPPRRHGHTPA